MTRKEMKGNGGERQRIRAQNAAAKSEARTAAQTESIKDALDGFVLPPMAVSRSARVLGRIARIAPLSYAHGAEQGVWSRSRFERRDRRVT